MRIVQLEGQLGQLQFIVYTFVGLFTAMIGAIAFVACSARNRQRA